MSATSETIRGEVLFIVSFDPEPDPWPGTGADQRSDQLTEITDPRDPRVAAFRNLKDRELRDREGLFLAESELVVRRLLTSRFVVRSLLVHRQRWSKLAGEAGRYATTAPIYVAEPAVMDGIAGFPVHRGVLALAVRGPALEAADLMARPGPLLVLEGVADPDNIGALFRTAAACGYRAVLCSPSTADPLYRKAIRSSMGATLHLPFAVIADWPNALRVASRPIVALTPDPRAPVLGRVRIPADHALLVGAEGPGLSAEAFAAATHRARIAMPRHAVDDDVVDSLNVAIATAIAMYELTRPELSDALAYKPAKR